MTSIRGRLLFSLLMMVHIVSPRLIDLGKSKAEDTDQLTLPLSVSASCPEDDAISLSNWNLASIPSNTIKSKLVKAVNLDNNALKNVPSNFFYDLPNIKCLNLAKNRISVNSLSDNYNSISLKTLILDDNRDYYGINYNIEYLFNVSFPRLTALRLSSNNIRVFNPKLPETLQHLYLQRNEINNFVLSGDNLHSLYLDYNTNFQQIEVHSPNLEVASFRGCSLPWHKLANFFSRDRFALKVLDLSKNNFYDVSNDLYKRAKNLEILILNNNQIARVPELNDLPRLHSLLLSHNMITSVGDMQLKSLTMLSLRDNNISEIAETTFRGLPKLANLDLSENRLQYLPKGWADGWKQMKMLNLTSNRFTSFREIGLAGLKPDFDNFRDLYLENNSITNITDQELNAFPKNAMIHLFGNWNKN